MTRSADKVIQEQTCKGCGGPPFDSWHEQICLPELARARAARIVEAANALLREVYEHHEEPGRWAVVRLDNLDMLRDALTDGTRS